MAGGSFVENPKFIIGYPRSLGYDCDSCTSVCCRNTSNLVYTNTRGHNLFPIKEFERMLRVRPEAGALMQGTRNQMISLARVSTGCVFLLDDNQCQVHRDAGYMEKPIACRLFPFLFAELDDCVLVYHHSCGNHSINARKPVEWDIEGSYQEWADKMRPPVGNEAFCRAYTLINGRPSARAENLERIRRAVTLYENESPADLREYLVSVWKVMGENDATDWDFEQFLERMEREMLGFPSLNMSEAIHNHPFAAHELLAKLIHNRTFHWETLFHDRISMMKILSAYAFLCLFNAQRIGTVRGEDAGDVHLLDANRLVEVSDPFKGANRRAFPTLSDVQALIAKPRKTNLWANVRRGLTRRRP